ARRWPMASRTCATRSKRPADAEVATGARWVGMTAPNAPARTRSAQNRLLLGLGVGLGLGLARAVRLLLRLLGLLGGLGRVAGRRFVGGLGNSPAGGEQNGETEEHDANEVHEFSFSLMWDADQ